MKMIRIKAFMTAMVLLLTMAACISLPAYAEEAERQEINSAEELCALAEGDLAGNYILKKDIDLSEMDFAPIGSVKTPFTGSFDGNGYTISGLTLSSDADFQGLFGVNNGEIRNVTLAEDCSIEGSSYVGAIAGFNGGTIENCISRASVIHLAKELPSTGEPIKIMSQNLCQWGDNDLTADPSYKDSQVNSRRPSMIKRIENSDPDIIFFQEVSFKDYKYNGKTITAWDTFLRNTLTDYTIVGTYRSNSDKEGVTVAFKKEKFELVEEGMFWLSPNPDAPRAEQQKAWDAACVRTAQWVVLKDKITGEQMIGCSTHTDHQGVIARDKGTKLVAERMGILQEKYPNALLAVGGDFNNNPGSQGYINMENGLNGLLDDSRYVAEERLNNIGTHGNINDLTYVSGELSTIDFIYVNSATTEVSTFYVMNDNYFDLRPSDHEGVFASVRMRENNFVGGICGANGGELRNIVVEGEVCAGEAVGQGAVLGNALLEGRVVGTYASDLSADAIVGTEVALNELTAEPSWVIVNELNKTSGVYELRENQYAIIKECGGRQLAKVTFRGIDRYLFVGDTFTFEAEEGRVVYLNGKPFEGRSIIVPPEGAEIAILEPITLVTQAVAGGDYIVENVDDFVYLYENAEYFKARGVTIHLFCDIDLSDEKLDDFKGFTNPAFSFEGHGFTIKNWGSKENPGGRALFRVSTGVGGMEHIRDLKLENIHVKGGNAAALYSVVHANSGLAGLSASLELSGISIDQCSMVATGQASGMLLSRYGAAGDDFTVDIFDISITNSFIDANNLEHIGFLCGKTRTANRVATYNFRDCYLADNTIINSVPGVGFVAGSVEAATYANFSNIGVFRNKASGTGISHLVSDSDCSKAITANGLIFMGNTAETDAAYMVEGVYNNAKATLSSIWSDGELTALIEGSNEAYVKTEASVLASGEAGYLLNQMQKDPAIWWKMEDGKYLPATEEERLYKTVLKIPSGEEIRYCNNGTEITLPDIGNGRYEIDEGKSTIENGILTVCGDSVIRAIVPVAEVNSEVAGGDYTVSSLEEWMTLYENLEFFRNRLVTIHLLCDLDLSQEEAAEFTYFENPAFSLDGHGFTISHWGSKEEPKEVRALFYVTEGSGGMRFLKNLKFSDCHISKDGNGAILYSVAQSNAGLEGLPTDFRMEGIQIKDCSAKVTGECGGFLISRYGVAGAPFTVSLRDCRVEDSLLEGGNTAHKGLLIGKPRRTDAAGTFNIEDCYLFGNTIADASNGVGFIIGSAEGSNTSVNIRNTAVVNNEQTASIAGAYAGASGGDGPIALKGVLFAGNTIHAENKYLVSNSYVSAFGTFENVYGDFSDLTATVEGREGRLRPEIKKIRSGEAGWLLNGLAQEPSFYWGFADEGYYSPTDAEHRLVKVNYLLETGMAIKTLYANGASSITLAVEEDAEATFEVSAGEFEENALILPKDATEVTVLVHTDYPDRFKEKKTSVIEITEPVNEGEYIVEDLFDWMYLFDHADYFNASGVTITLAADLDLSAPEAARFTGFYNVAFSLNGADHKISGWTSLSESTLRGAAFFDEYKGAKITDLTIEDCEIGGGYARALLIANYSGGTSLEISNIHVKNCVVDATAEGNQMGILLARPKVAAENGATITVRNCSVVDSALESSSGARINNSGILVGSAYKKYRYILTDNLIQGCSVNTDTGAGGIVIGAAEEADTVVVMERIGVFDCSMRVADTNEIPGVFFGEGSGTPSITLKNCMAAAITAEQREKLAIYCHSKPTVSVEVENCFADFAPIWKLSTDNACGIAKEEPTAVAGITQLSNDAFKSGEAAWQANNTALMANWRVADDFAQYPTMQAQDGYAAPFKVTFGEAEFFTNSEGLLPAAAAEMFMIETGSWMAGDQFASSDRVYVADTALVLQPHLFTAEGATPLEGGEHHMFCINGCGAEKTEACSYGDFAHQWGENDAHLHQKACLCGNVVSEECTFNYTRVGEGVHTKACATCRYEENVLCSYGDWSHVCEEERHFHQKTCICGDVVREECEYKYYAVAETEMHKGICETCKDELEPIACTMVPSLEKAPALGECGLMHYTCADGCGHEREEVLTALGDVRDDGKITISDVVLLMRVVLNRIEISSIDPAVANVYTEDGITENGGLNTADALAILRYLLNQ